MIDVIQKYGKLVTINDANTTDEMLKRFTELPESRHHDMWIRDSAVGDVGIYLNSEFDGKVLEVVIGRDETLVSTLFASNPIFSSRKELAEARKHLINEIGAVTMSLPSQIAIKDEGRGREVSLREMSTAQLIDILDMARAGNFGMGAR
jgi:hypothetical protein